MPDAPSPRRIFEAMTILRAAKDRLLAEDPDIESDDHLLHDMLEGEAEGDPFAVLDQIIRAAIEAGDRADAAKLRAEAILARAERYNRRRDALRGVAFGVMDALGLKRHERPDFTASVRAGAPALTITDPTLVPDELMRVTRAPDKAAIRERLKRGEAVPGAELSNAAPTLAIKTT